ncbi:uncharacterized protein FOMMEDRAFT_104080 [Fomitiporia mediterranea MF3/22]|uniref:uncharacterized protein n=1 Tax=Fomitiporia mediterranea (strain MF3/22) TaxID=694068 RepID=UPI0004409A10|nr:uncharacterized protein FOMMEDRAFT_104080 [Fomitiporia mediterranea MF3/22]EJD05816.1 hypothetical protein FOMMEDRAFT_104080 [Fomitiporia mediterranea MF3/22]
MPATTTTATNKTLRVLPAHETKHLSLLAYPFRDDIVFNLAQLSDGANNGTALWLGAQILSAYLTDTLPSPSPLPIPGSTRHSRTPRAIELGSGVGLTSLVLAVQGWSVLATDIPAIVLSVLRPNVQRNTRETCLLGSVQVRALDWTVPPDNWNWDNPLSIAGTLPDGDVGTGRLDKQGLEEELLGPPFDLILTSDTIYSRELVTPLLRTIKHLALLSTPQLQSPSKSHPPIYLALEVRDPTLVSYFFTQARVEWGMDAQRVSTPRIRRAMSRSGLGDWKREDWEGVEVWRLHLLDSQPKEASNSVDT